MNNTIKDSDIREALRRMYSNTPSLPPDFNERILKRILAKRDDNEQVNNH